MAIFQSSGIFGYLCSVLKTGKQDKDGRPIYVENFLSGFAGWGWKIWKTVAGFFRLEIDELVVRRTMTVFELMIQKIRAVKGAIAITQANGKIKTAVPSEDETAYLITLEEDDMSFVEYDYFRCQEFNGGQKFYHVEIESVEGGVIRVPISEFEGSSLPMSGDEIVQFGNSSRDAKYAGRHSAIYMHADESEQPAMDVMFDIYSKDWTNCVKVRLGGDIPGGDGAKGFYCQNGMILSVDDTNNMVYQFSPNGGFSLGRGKIVYDPVLDKVTLKGITLSWDDIENAPDIEGGEPGKDGRYMSYQYAVNTNPSVAPTTGWTGTIPSVGVGQYLWERRGTVIPPATEPESWSPGLRVTGANGNSVFVTYHDSDSVPALPTGNGTTDGWHTDATDAVVWMSQKVAATAEASAWGEPIKIKGKDANLLPWVEQWNNNKTLIDGEYVVSPKMFSGTKRTENGVDFLTGIAQGKDCITTTGGVNRTGIFALVDNEVVFELDPISKRYLFKGRVESDEGIFKGRVEIAGGKILLKEDGSGQLSNGNLYWDVNGNLYSRSRLKPYWRNLAKEELDAGNPPGTYSLNISKGTYCNILCNALDPYTFILPSPDEEVLVVLDFMAAKIGRTAASCKIIPSSGNRLYLRNSNGTLTNVTSVLLAEARTCFGTITSEQVPDTSGYSWIASGDFA